MNNLICLLLTIIAILNLGQVIYLKRKLNTIEGQIRGQKKVLDRLDNVAEIELRFKDEIIRGKLEEINQRVKEVSMK